MNKVRGWTGGHGCVVMCIYAVYTSAFLRKYNLNPYSKLDLNPKPRQLGRQSTFEAGSGTKLWTERRCYHD